MGKTEKVYIMIRATKTLKDKAKKRAEDITGNLSEYIRLLIIKDLERKND